METFGTEYVSYVFKQRYTLKILMLLLPVTSIYFVFINGMNSSIKETNVLTIILKGDQAGIKFDNRLIDFVHCKDSEDCLRQIYNGTEEVLKCKDALKYRQFLRKHESESLQISNTSIIHLDVLSADTKALIPGNVRYSDYISLKEFSCGIRLVRYIENASLQWVLHTDKAILQDFRESTESAMRPSIYNGRIANGYTDILKRRPLPFLGHLKNPCWMHEHYGLLCLPYMYLIGFPKCGTSDVFNRIRKHPQFMPPIKKERSWLCHERFAVAESETLTIEPLRQAVKLETFLREHFSPLSTYISEQQQLEGNDNFTKIITGDFTAFTGMHAAFWRLLPENKNRTEPLHTNADYIRHLNPKTKIVAILRNPVDGLYSAYKYFHEKSLCKLSPENFHNNVVVSHDAMYRCFRLHSIRRCAYDDRLHFRPPLYICLGMYPVYLLDFIRVFPRKQIFFMTTANYSKNLRKVMKELFSFLDLDKLDESIAEEIESEVNANMGPKNIGPMLNETRRILHAFYKPFNILLAELLGDPAYKFDV